MTIRRVYDTIILSKETERLVNNMTVETRIGKVTATEDVLNEMSLVLDYASDELKRRGYDNNSERYKDASLEIFNALKNIGLYD